MDRETYLDREHWSGTYYELAMEYITRDDERLSRALAALWKIPALLGPWQEIEHFGQAPALATTIEEAEGHTLLHGVLQLSGCQPIGCLSITLREEQGSDWLELCLPLGMLELAFPVDYQDGLSHKGNPWLAMIDEQFLAIADHIYWVAPFDVAVIGEEASTVFSWEELPQLAHSWGMVLAPPALARTLGGNASTVTLPSGLVWYPWQRQ